MLSDELSKCLGVPQETPEEAGVLALHRLARVAQGESGQCRYVRRFLLGLYNGTSWPLDMTCLRALDSALQNDVLAVLRMDMTPRVEIHQRIEDGQALFREWWYREKGSTGD